MRVIFIDIDGVILPVGAMSGKQFRDLIRDPGGYVEDAAGYVPAWTVAHLRTLAEQTDAQFVLISSWRGVLDSTYLQTFLRLVGLFDYCHVDWEAPMQGHPPRPVKGRDIGAWLGAHPGYEALVIDDDDLRLRTDFGLRKVRVIKPISEVGFSRDDLARALRVKA